MSIVVEAEKWQPLELPASAESLQPYTLTQHLVQVNRWIFQYQIQSNKVNRLTPKVFASPLPQEFVPTANKPVDESNRSKHSGCLPLCSVFLLCSSPATVLFPYPSHQV
jgi:hypothetical protein